MRFLIATLLACLLAAPALAGTWSGVGSGSGSQPISSAKDKGFYSFTSADSTSDTAVTFRVVAVTAQVCFNADTAGAPAGTAQVQLRRWPQGDTTAGSGFSIPMGGANGNSFLDGTGGEEFTQNACQWIGPGVYTLDIEVACGAGDACLLSVEGS